ncbi:MAG: CBS domain-containing protein, partial [Slackia piriformis]|nr:CBS domain-containing protein [Slackia piriformis]
QATEAISEMEDEYQADFIEDLDDARAAGLLGSMDPDDAADIVRDLSYEKAETLLRLMGVEDATEIRRLLGYKDGTAGGMMTTQFVSVHATDTVGEVIEVLRELPEDHPTVHYVYVLDEYDEFEGVLSLRTLVLTDDARPVGDVMYEDVISVPPDETEEDVAADIFKYELPAMPVVDEHGGTSGVVTMGDIFEEIIGDYDDEYVHSNNETLTEVSEGHYLTTGACAIDDFAECVGLDADGFPEYETLGGLLLESFDRIPDAGDETVYTEDNVTVRFVVRSMDARRIGQVEFWASVEEPEEGEK